MLQMYDFSKWYNGSTKASSSATFAPTNVQGAMTLQARATQTTRSYTVTYVKGDYISAVSRASESVLYNGNAAGSTATVSTGYDFSGWYEGSTRIFTTLATGSFGPITGNRTLTAKATIKTFAITAIAQFKNTDGGTSYTEGTDGGTVTGGGTYNYGSTATLTASAKTGYRLV